MCRDVSAVMGAGGRAIDGVDGPWSGPPAGIPTARAVAPGWLHGTPTPPSLFAKISAWLSS
jgi:hypothetical protein